MQLVLTNGNPQDLGRELQRPIGYANKEILARFHIQHVPSLLGIGDNQHYFDLAITDFAYPYSTKLFELCWHGCSDAVIDAFSKGEIKQIKQIKKSEVDHA